VVEIAAASIDGCSCSLKWGRPGRAVVGVADDAGTWGQTIFIVSARGLDGLQLEYTPADH
jgi:hypothetical protein